MGSVGGDWPTLQRGHWFSQPNDVFAFRTKLAHLCRPVPASSLSPPGMKGGEEVKVTTKEKKFKLSIYQRDLSR